MWSLLALLALAFLGHGRWADPPFWDDLMGFHRQALFLADHGFDFRRLAEAGDFWNGGPRVYRLWHLPSIVYGMAYAWLDASVARVFGHMLNALLTASALGLLACLVGRSRFPWVLAAAFSPLIAAQSLSLGQEPWINLAFMAVVFGVWCRSRGWVLGGLLAGTMVKPVMVVPAVALVLYGIYLCLRGGKPATVIRRWWWSVPATVLIVLLLFGDSDGAVRLSWWMLLCRMAEHWLLYLPHSGLLLALVLVLVCFRFRALDRFGVFLLLLQLCFWGAYALYSVPLPRYAGASVMPALLLIGRMLVRCRPLWRNAVSGMILAAGILCCTGRMMPELPEHLRASGEFQERSPEYLVQLDEDRKLCRSLEERGLPVMAKWPYAMMLAEPRFGYVSAPPPSLYCAGILPRDWPFVKSSADMRHLKGRIRIMAYNSFEFFSEFGEPTILTEVPLVPLEKSGRRPVWLLQEE